MNTSPPLVGLKGLATGTSANTVYPRGIVFYQPLCYILTGANIIFVEE
jgi:hypothetical protein